MAAAPNLIEFPQLAGASGEPPKAPGKRKRRKRDAPPFLTFEETARFFKAIDSAPSPRRERDRAIFQIVYHAGLRASEVGKLELRDYNPKTERIHVHRLKGSNSGDHHLMKEEGRALRAWLKIRGAGPGVIFTSRLGSPISRDQLDELMKKYGAKAGLPETLRHMHVWKHTCCTHLRMMGKAVEDIQDWVGHVNIQNALIYSHLTNAQRDEIAKSLKDRWR